MNRLSSIGGFADDNREKRRYIDILRRVSAVI